MDKIKRFLDCYVPIEACNLRCHYCYITQKRKFNSKIEPFTHSPADIRTALSQKRTGGICLINLCAGGETLLSTETICLAKELLEEGHYIMIVTNGTLASRFDEISKWPSEFLHHLFFKFSFHYLELKRLNILECFFDNIHKIKAAGASFTVEITPSDELIPLIDEVKGTCLKYLGTLCHVTFARDDRTRGIEILTNHTFDEYKKTWGIFNSTLFDFKGEIFYQKRNEFCYAGEWSAWIHLGSGAIFPCNCGSIIDNLYDHLESPIRFCAIGKHCTLPHCYNGHAWLTLGNIPSMKTPTYAEVRNRICDDGTEWLQPEMKYFLNSKLNESNPEYSVIKKFQQNIITQKGRLLHYMNRFYAKVLKV